MIHFDRLFLSFLFNRCHIGTYSVKFMLSYKLYELCKFFIFIKELQTSWSAVIFSLLITLKNKIFITVINYANLT